MNAAQKKENTRNRPLCSPQDYFDSHGGESSYATVYDGKVLVVEEIKNEEASSSMAATAEHATHNQPSASSTINIAELLDLVKGDARKYIPKPTVGKKDISTGTVHCVE